MSATEDEDPASLLGAAAEELVPALAPIIDAQAQKWVAAAVGSIEKLIPALPSQVQGLFAAAAKSLGDNSTVIGQVSGQEFGSIVHHLAMGNEDAARLAWLGGGATFEDRMKARDDASDATRASDARSLERWTAVKDVGQTVVKAIITAGIPMVLAL